MQIVLVVVTMFLFVGYSILLFLYKKSWSDIPYFIYDEKKITAHVFISIIVPARNEENNITTLIHSLLLQSYPKDKYEIIVIDDHSTDTTFEKVNALKSDSIKIIALKNHVNSNTTNSFKKKAIEIGISAAKGSLIVTTDADCTMGEKWLLTINAYYQTFQPKMIVMPVLIQNNQSPLGVFQTLDFMCLQGITGAAIYKKWHGMGNGANLAYTKTAFEEVKGFESIDHIASGDDFFLIQKMKKEFPKDIFYLKSKDVIVSTEAQKGIRNFLKQRIRWASKASKYPDKSLFPVLLLVYLFNFFLTMMFVVGELSTLSFSFNSSYHISILSLFFFLLLLKTFTELIFLFPISRFFKKTSLLFWFVFFQPFHLLYTIVSGLFGSFGSYEWKGRRVR